jgi:hypothetical protein
LNREDLRFAGITALLIVAALIGVWATTHYIPEEYHVRRALGLTVCEALLVAAFLGATVDVYLKKALIRDLSKDVFQYLAGYGLPEEIKQRIRELMGTFFVRHNWDVSFTLSPIPESDDVYVDVIYSYELENVTNETKRYPFMVQAEKRLNPRILELRCDDPKAHFCKIAPPGGSLGEDQQNLMGVLKVVEEIDVKPSSRNAGLRYPCRGHYQLRTPSSSGDTFSFGQTSVDVTLTTSCPDGYEFSIEAEPDTIVTPNMWQFRRRAFLHGEHIMVRWFKK